MADTSAILLSKEFLSHSHCILMLFEMKGANNMPFSGTLKSWPADLSNSPIHCVVSFLFSS
jgi:hypothetical protein